MNETALSDLTLEGAGRPASRHFDQAFNLEMYGTTDEPTTLCDLVDLSLENATAEIRRKEEQFYRHAILGTDWRETSVLRIIHYPPAPAPALTSPGEPTINVGEYAVERYEDRAPPLSEHATSTGQQPLAATITWPLLERLAEHHTEFEHLVDVALGPTLQ